METTHETLLFRGGRCPGLIHTPCETVGRGIPGGTCIAATSMQVPIPVESPPELLACGTDWLHRSAVPYCGLRADPPPLDLCRHRRRGVTRLLVYHILLNAHLEPNTLGTRWDSRGERKLTILYNCRIIQMILGMVLITARVGYSAMYLVRQLHRTRYHSLPVPVPSSHQRIALVYTKI